MASQAPKTNTFRKKDETRAKAGEKKQRKFSIAFLKNKKIPITVGIVLIILAIVMFFAFVSYIFTGKADQSALSALDQGLRESANETRNWQGYFGAYVAELFIRRWFGIAAFLLPPFLFLLGVKLAFKISLFSLSRYSTFALFFTFWLGLFTGYIVQLIDGYSAFNNLSGGFGYELGRLSNDFLGWGSFVLIAGALLIFVIFFFNIDHLSWSPRTSASETDQESELESNDHSESKLDSFDLEEADENENEEDINDLFKKMVENSSAMLEKELPEDNADSEEDGSSWTINATENETKKPIAQPEFNIEGMDDLPEEEEVIEEVDRKFSVHQVDDEEKTADQVANLDPYDPTLDLPRYQYPTIELLNEYDVKKVTVTRQELEENKNKIVETLVNFKIGIQEIKATIGPTVTLYEIVPDPGVKISKIKNLEDDIALSLAALGIRIIAPIPGKGTIGIEVPNKNRELVPARAVLGTEKFMHSDKDLPVALGKTISNEVFVMDLAKMPHLLMAGATGQGKSVGLNMILASLVYKKHPSQLKFVLVDPKKVELTLFNKIERHFLAKLPGAEEAIITDTKKVIYTLNSLCTEMDNRYDLLKDAGCRNLKEYNAKFVARKLNPEKGHRFMPYIVLVIDELADLMMTAGKEIEAPIARLAQLARAIGIHLVVATQRPSVNVITGIIKANFPARLSFRVTSKIDSRTILDAGGADQLIGMGDMLLSSGSEMTRLQCAFLDTPEVDAICDWIGEQGGYPDAYLLPEFVGEEGDGSSLDVDLADRDPLFDDAARLIVMHQQGSTSLIQRKLKLGYNRAGRIVDQLEAAGIVGPFEGSKAREVLIQDEASLERLLSSL
ncbi:DNA translocase FtsK 4TM domain-containing protein [Belliella kenyensis]|uniref:DNA translocase FtsK 4TM domain-containing protein n=1 Tax=Belliella kenyensis TaxID=1472724 RepID=A0ABV8ES18_9BACT|nr:DNA translocase FtsK [Belliella kenyensis]MCH7402829.1 DNA translocase FtsK [Belliella kenyensis]MDN3602535.1 DNA translocase FtsK 4TM domain-containing protein [Belliella kenyensis]